MGGLSQRALGATSLYFDGDRLYVNNTKEKHDELVILGPHEIKHRPLSATERELGTIPPEAVDSPTGRRLRALNLFLKSTCSLWGFRIPAELCQKT